MITLEGLPRRLLALPIEERQEALRHLEKLVRERRAKLPPSPLSPVELAQKAGLDPDPWQREMLESQASRILLNCSRQSGKSTVTALLAMHTALYRAQSLILLLSPSLRQSGELFKKAKEIYRALGSSLVIEAESALRLELANGSRIVSLPGKEHSIRGFSGVELLAVDEAARVPDDLYLSIRPMLAVSGGRMIALSTPFGTRGWWHDAWHSRQDWHRFEIPASQCPRISLDFLAEERLAMGEWWYAQEYECRFLDAETQPFSREDVEKAFQEDVEAWDL